MGYFTPFTSGNKIPLTCCWLEDDFDDFDDVLVLPPPKTNMAGWNIHHEKMHFLLKMGDFWAIAMLVFSGV